MRQRSLATCAVLLLVGTAGAAAALPPEHRPPRIVICLDGTQNGPEQAVESEGGGVSLYKPTNVLKIFRAIEPKADDGTSQLAYYSDGVGSMIGEISFSGRVEADYDRVFGGALGIGYESRVKAAYRFLLANYQPGDQIVVIGFSRGAAEAQSLVRFIDWMGGLLRKRDEYYIPEMWAVFADKRGAPGEAERRIKWIRSRRQKESAIGDPVPVAIEFLGVFDTVLSVGSRLAPEAAGTTVEAKYAYLVGPTPPKIVKTVRQALAIDENRWDFRPQIWQCPSPDSVRQSLAQLWFPGVHSNVGGGFRHDGLADAALMWMVEEMQGALERDGGALALDYSYLEHYFPQGPCVEPSRPGPSLFYEFLDLIRLKAGKGVRDLDAWDRGGSWPQAGLNFHESLGKLLIDDCTYRPKNLLKFLVEDAGRIGMFPLWQQDEIRAIVADWKCGVKKPDRCKCVPCQAKEAGEDHCNEWRCPPAQPGG
jgi:uncharacterized protein (DUF2235 family)